MSVRDDRIGQPPDLHPNHPTHFAELVGRGVAYEHGDIAPRHGTIVSANYSLSGETVLVVHPDRPCEVLAKHRPDGPPCQLGARAPRHAVRGTLGGPGRPPATQLRAGPRHPRRRQQRACTDADDVIDSAAAAVRTRAPWGEHQAPTRCLLWITAALPRRQA